MNCLGRVFAIPTRNQMQRIAAQRVIAKPGDNIGTDVAPSALVDGLVECHVFRLLFAVGRTVRGKAETLGNIRPSVFDLPALVHRANLNQCPELMVFEFVV